MDSISKCKAEKLFKNKEYCYQTINEIREMFGNRNTTREEYGKLEFCLGYLLLYCPENIRYIVISIMDESVKRRLYFEFNVWN